MQNFLKIQHLKRKFRFDKKSPELNSFLCIIYMEKGDAEILICHFGWWMNKKELLTHKRIGNEVNKRF